jgi:rhodanese-related sulfurtransferase
MEHISAETLKERLENQEKVQLLDVREDHEHAEFNIGGVHIPLGKISLMEIDAIEPFKNEEIICYCKSGKRSLNACMLLETFGFTQVKNLTGGMMEWQQKYGAV